MPHLCFYVGTAHSVPFAGLLAVFLQIPDEAPVTRLPSSESLGAFTSVVQWQGFIARSHRLRTPWPHGERFVSSSGENDVDGQRAQRNRQFEILRHLLS